MKRTAHPELMNSFSLGGIQAKDEMTVVGKLEKTALLFCDTGAGGDRPQTSTAGEPN